jgi:DNA polymerase alpha/epsilon subunit B
MLCYVMLCYDMLCYVMLCYVMLCYDAPAIIAYESIPSWSNNYVILFWCYLNLQLIEKLQRVLEGFEQTGSTPLFILMGNFVSKPARSPGGRETITACFSALADAIASCPRLAANAKFLLVPGKIAINSKQYYITYRNIRRALTIFIYLLFCLFYHSS